MLKPRRPSGLTLVDHVGDTDKRKHWCGTLCLGLAPIAAIGCPTAPVRALHRM